MKETPVVMATKAKGLSKPLRNRRSLFMLIAALGVLVVVALFVFIILKPALKVGNYSYSRGEYKQLINQAKKQNISEDNAREAIIAGLASRSAADELGVTYPSDKSSVDQAAAYKYVLPDGQEVNDYQRVTAISNIVGANVALKQSGGYKVALVYFPFARYLYGFFDGSNATQRGADVKLIGNSAAIQKDITYADAKAIEMRGAYINKSKSIENIVNEVASDKVLGYGQASNKTRIAYVTNDGTVQSYRGASIVPENIQLVIDANKDRVGQPSELKEEVLPGPAFPGRPDLSRQGGSYVGKYFVVVDAVIKAQPGVQSQYDQRKRELQQ